MVESFPSHRVSCKDTCVQRVSLGDWASSGQKEEGVRALGSTDVADTGLEISGLCLLDSLGAQSQGLHPLFLLLRLLRGTLS